MNTAFEFLRQHREVKPDVEDLVLRKMRYSCSESEMLSAFENGITGKYGKIYLLDAQTLIKWINNFKNEGKDDGIWINSVLIDPGISQHHKDYPLTNKQWNRQINKAFMTYKSGLSETRWHPDMYSYLVLDDKIKLGALKKYAPKNYPDCDMADIYRAMQLCIKEFFAMCDKSGMQFIYTRNQCEVS